MMSASRSSDLIAECSYTFLFFCRFEGCAFDMYIWCGMFTTVIGFFERYWVFLTKTLGREILSCLIHDATSLVLFFLPTSTLPFLIQKQ